MKVTLHPWVLAAWAIACGPPAKFPVPDLTPPPSLPPPAGDWTPSATMGPEPCKSAGGDSVASLFPCENYWLRDVSTAPVSPESTSIVYSIVAWGAGKFLIDFSMVVLWADNNTPRARFALDYEDESDPGAVPVPIGGALEEEEDYVCAKDGDCHLIVVEPAGRKLFELWRATNDGGIWRASQQTIWDLSRRYGPEGRGYGCTSADAAGLPIAPGLIGLKETLAGDIRHALRFILPNSKIRKGPSFVAPATHGTDWTSSASGPPFGTRLRLKASFDERRVTSKGGVAIVRALKRYGMYLADGGDVALTAESDQLAKKKDPKMSWEGVLGSNDIAMIRPSDFEVVEFSEIRRDTDCRRY